MPLRAIKSHKTLTISLQVPNPGCAYNQDIMIFTGGRMRTLIVFAGFILAAAAAFAATPYVVHPLISDIPDPANPNIIVEPSAVDPWGIAIGASSPFWISNAGTGLATVYSYSATSTCAGATPNLSTLPG